MKTLYRVTKSALALLSAMPLLLGGCADEGLVGLEGTPAWSAALPENTQVQNGGSPHDWGARILREEQGCVLPGIASDGTSYPLFDIPCDVQLVLTRNGQDVANSMVRATVPNEYGRAVTLRFGNPGPIRCFVNFDTDNDGTPDIFRETARYQLTVSASGRLRLNCQFPET